MHPRVLRELLLTSAAQPGRAAHVAAASGAVRIGDQLFVISDDERALASFSLSSARASWLPLPGEPLPLEPKARKARKPDFEALLWAPSLGALVAFPSGSAPARFEAMVIPLSPGAPYAVDVAPLLDAVAQRVPKLNIEGAVLDGESLVLLQRGNAAQGVSALVRVEAAPVLEAISKRRPLASPGRVDLQPLQLPFVQGVPLTPTDVTALGGGRLLLSAVAEATDDPYLDGACVGAGLVMVEPDGTLRTVLLSHPWKVEGVALSESGSVLLVTDADDPTRPAVLLEGALPPDAE